MAVKGNVADIISTQYLIPGVFNKFDASNAIRGPREMPRSVLLFGQVNNVLFNPANFNKRMTVTTESEAKGLFGEGSVLFDMWMGAKKNAGLGLPIRCIALPDDPDAIAAVYTLTVTADTNHLTGELPVYQGVSIAIAIDTPGAINPDLTDAITNIRNSRDTEWIIPYTDGSTLAMVEEEAYRRWSHEVQTDFQFITAMRGTEAQHTKWLQPRNNPLGHSIHTTKDMTSPWVTAAMAGAVIESMASLNPCTPHTGAVLVGYKGALIDDTLENDQINLLMVDGGSGLTTQEDGTANLMRMVTNYTTHNTGAYDTSMRELTWIKNLSWYRWYRNVEFAIKTQGFLIGEYAEAIPGQKIMTYEVAEDFLLAIYDNAIGIARMQHRDHYQKTMVLQLQGPEGRVKVQDEPVIMNGLYQTMITSQWAAGHV